jgi:hypothetical protein
MNVPAYLLLAATLSVLGGGCATDATDDGLPLQVVEISAVQTETESSAHGGLSAPVATNLFNDVASRLGSLGSVGYLTHYPTKPTCVEYTVTFTPPGANTVDLYMDIDGKNITFRGETDTDPKSVAALQKAMTLYRGALDERQVKYEVRTYTTHLFAIPS